MIQLCSSISYFTGLQKVNALSDIHWFCSLLNNKKNIVTVCPYVPFP